MDRAESAGWGNGAIQLVELTAPNETFDNIVAYWNPATPPQARRRIALQLSHVLGHAVCRRRRRSRRRSRRAPVSAASSVTSGDYFSWRFAIDFAGGELAALAKSTEVEPVISVSRGTIETPSARPLQAIGGFRAMFDVKPPDDSVEPIDIRLFLRHRRQPLTETWIYQWTPPSAQERRAALELASRE